MHSFISRRSIFFALVAIALSMLPAALVVAEKPNIILIMADDVSWECFSCYGAEDYKTPRIDQLASAGIRFANCYSTPICTTSRVKLMTGKYNFRNYTHFGYLNPAEKTFAQLLKQAGYRTAVAGKWQLNGLYNDLPGCDDASRPVKLGFDEYMLWQLTTAKGGDKRGGERYWSPPIEHNGKFLTKEMNEGKFGPDMFCDFVCDFIERNQDQPFFVYYPMALVHDPFVPTPDTIGSRSPSHELNVAPNDPAEKKANFVAMVNYMDQIVGRIVDRVETLGLSEKTMILFTADNGTNRAITSRWNGREIKGGKAGLTDMGTHVPFAAYWKNHTPERMVSNDLIDFTDFYPTLAEAAEIKLGETDPFDGRSFFPQLNGKPGNPRDWVLCHYEPYWNQIPGQFVRNADFKLYRDGRFYNVPNDLEEGSDLSTSTDARLVQIRSGLESILDACPPAPTGNKADKNTQDRPVYPNWKKLDQ